MAYLDRGEGPGEGLAAKLRPGNAGANTAADPIDVFETALDQLGDVSAETRVLVRADSGGSAKQFLAYVAEAGVDF